MMKLINEIQRWIGRCVILAVAFTSTVAANDWPSWRGPEQSGLSREKAVVMSWSPNGENVLWKVPVGGRTTPIVMDGRLFAITPMGTGAYLRELVICLDANTGRTIWEHPINVFHTDIVENRLGWTAMAGDPETGNVYVHGTGGQLYGFNRNGSVLWKRSLTEEFGRSSGYGGRLHTPIVDQDLVVISIVHILTRWGGKPAGHRYLAFDKRTGELVWASQPGGRPKNTTYSVPAVTVVDGKRILVTGNADGTVYGMMANTGEKIWSFPFSKTGINSSIVADGKFAYVTHSEENIVGTKMGSVVCLDTSKTGDISETGVVWRHDGLAIGYASPSLANGRLYVVTNNANMLCFNAKSGAKKWEYSLGRVMKSSPVVTADGVIYAGEVNGRFLILRDVGDRCKPLDIDEFPKRGDAGVEINGSPAVVNGRVYFANTYEMYCLGKTEAAVQTASIPPMVSAVQADASTPAYVRVIPAEATIAPGERINFSVALFDANGQKIGLSEAQWSSAGVGGAFDGPGTFLAGSDRTFSAGKITATVDSLTADALLRVSPNLPIHENFDAMKIDSRPPGWIGVALKTKIVEREGEIVFKKEALRPSAKYGRMRSYSGLPLPAGYTVEADLLGEPKKGRRPTLSDMGLINARYKMILLGYEKAIRLVTYSPIPRLQVEVPFEWEANTWYRAKFSFEVIGGKGYARGKVWQRNEQEPADWMIEMIDPCPNLEGSPGLYAYSKGTTGRKPGAPVYFDNYRVYRSD